MRASQLTKIQQQWLHHVNQAAEQDLSMSAYAQKNNLALKSFYNARSVLIQKGALPQTINTSLLAVAATADNTGQKTAFCRITLCNGVNIEFTDMDIDALLNAASRL